MAVRGRASGGGLHERSRSRAGPDAIPAGERQKRQAGFSVPHNLTVAVAGARPLCPACCAHRWGCAQGWGSIMAPPASPVPRRLEAVTDGAVLGCGGGCSGQAPLAAVGALPRHTDRVNSVNGGRNCAGATRWASRRATCVAVAALVALFS